MHDPHQAPIDSIAIFGAGLAGRMAAAALARQAPASIGIVLIDCPDAGDSDLLYGNLAPPTAYDFNLLAGLSEPRLLLESDAAFSWGARYSGWGGADWIQCFHLPLPVAEGVQFHHYLARRGIEQLEPYLVSAMAARAGAFAHPPADSASPLSRAEYGYHFDPQAYAASFASCTDRTRVRLIQSTIADVVMDERIVRAVRLANGESLAADLYLDCTGPNSLLMSRLGAPFTQTRRVRAAGSKLTAAKLGPPVRTLKPAGFGWQAETPLQGATARLTIYDPQSEREALAAHGGPPHVCEATLGQRTQAWVANCVALGQAACVIEPLTPAPILLLQRDIERLLSLIPASRDMSVERREFNRQFSDDCLHAHLFDRALFETRDLPDGPYWRAARATPVHEKLARKLEMFESRGLLVAYDLEPFNPEDWTILHYGMRRRAARHDRMADRAPEAQLSQYLSSIRGQIEKVVSAMPNHDAYVSGLTRFLKQQGNVTASS